MSHQCGIPCCTLVAGCNGPETGTTQLLILIGLYFDSLSNSLLVANNGSHNIVRWALGANSWTLVDGSINNSNGPSSILFQIHQTVNSIPWVTFTSLIG